MRADPNYWHDLPWCSDGKLELSKSGYHIILYCSFQDDRISVLRHAGGDNVKLKAIEGQAIEIDSKHISNPRKNFVYRKSPTGAHKTETDEILKISMNLN